VKDHLRHLLQLQAIDSKIKEIQGQIKTLPSRLEPARRDLAKLESMLTAEKHQVAETEALKKQRENLREREQESLKSAKSKLSASKTGKEFNAATREIDFKKKAIHDREGEIKEMDAALSTTREQATAHEKDVEQIRQSLAGEEADVAERVKNLEEEIAKVAAGSDELRAKIDKELLKVYDSLITRPGYRLAPVIKGVCQGCHTSLPPQMNNLLARGESFERCPRCLRIVYRPEAIEEPKPS
jgi:uncharacterized protein